MQLCATDINQFTPLVLLEKDGTTELCDFQKELKDEFLAIVSSFEKIQPLMGDMEGMKVRLNDRRTKLWQVSE